MKTNYFTLGMQQVHVFNGKRLDKDVVVKITDKDPRKKMFEFFGDEWSFQYDKKPKIERFSKGVFNLNTSKFE